MQFTLVIVAMLAAFVAASPLPVEADAEPILHKDYVSMPGSLILISN